MSESSVTATSVSSVDASPTTTRLGDDTFSSAIRPSTTSSLLDSDVLRSINAGGPFDNEHELWDQDDFDDSDLHQDSRVKAIASVIMGALLFVLLLGGVYWYIKRLTQQRRQASRRSSNAFKNDMIPLQVVASHGSGDMQTTGITLATDQAPPKIPDGKPFPPPPSYYESNRLHESILPPPPVHPANGRADKGHDAGQTAGPQASGVVSLAAGNRDSIESQAILAHDTRRRSSIVSPIDEPRHDGDLDLEHGLKPVGTKEFI